LMVALAIQTGYCFRVQKAIMENYAGPPVRTIVIAVWTISLQHFSLAFQ